MIHVSIFTTTVETGNDTIKLAIYTIVCFEYSELRHGTSTRVDANQYQYPN